MPFLHPRFCMPFLSLCLIALSSTTALAQTTINYLSMTEIDETNDIIRSSDCIAFTDLETRHRHSFVYKEHMTANDFTYEFDTVITASDTFSGETVVWGISNTGNETFDAWDDGAALGWYKAGSSSFRLELEDLNGASDNSINLTFGQRYYIRVIREGTTLSAYIYDDVSRSNLIDTLSRDFGSASFSFFYGLSADDGISSGKKATGDVCHLTYLSQGGAPADQEAPGTPLGISLSNATHSTLDVSWDPSTDNVGVAGYYLDVAYDVGFTNMLAGYNNKNVGTSVFVSVTNLQEQTTYYIRVRAFDAAGNVSPNSLVVYADTLSAPVLEESSEMMPMDYSLMEVADESQELSVNSQRIDFTNVETRALNSFVYRDFKSKGDFVYEMDAMISASDTFSGETTIWGISNTANETYDDWSDGAILAFYKSGGIFRLELENRFNFSSDNSTALSLNQRYYLRVKREGSTLTAEIYDDVSRTNLIDTLTRTFNTDDFNYLYGFSLEDGTVLNWKVTGDVCQLKVDENTYYTNFPKPTDFVKNIEYNVNGQITSLEYGNGVVTTYTYDLLSFRLERLHSVDPDGEDIQDLRYAYDGVGNIISITDFVHTANQTFGYDELNRLVSAQGQMYGDKIYLYDEIGNLLEKDGKTYMYGEGPAGPHAVTSIMDNGDNTTFTYDENGNMATKQKGADITFYDFDVENRLKQVKINNDVIADYQYDGDGGRTTKTSYDPTTQQTQYVGALFEQTNGQGIKNIYLGSQRVAVIREDNTIRYYHNDHLGGANVLTNDDGVKQEVIEYKPFGEFSRHDMFGTGEKVANFYYTSQMYDQESQLYFYNARYYDPVVGRFISADDIVQNPTDPSTLNRYSYTSNNPVNRVDPDGHFWKSIKKFFKKFGDFVSPFFRAVFTGDWKNFASQLLNVVTMFVAPFPINIAGGLSYASRATSHIGSREAMEISKGLNFASKAISVAYVGWNVGVGIKEWAVGDLNVTDLDGISSAIESGDNALVNGVNTTLEGAVSKAQELNELHALGINKVVHNQTHGLIADFTESFLQKVTFTSSIDRQLAGMVRNLNNVTLIGYSQGSLVVSNALLNLGFSDARNSVVNAKFFSTPLSQPRAFISAAIGGTRGSVFYGNNWGDPINLIGPNINPAKFLSGLSFQFQNH